MSLGEFSFGILVNLILWGIIYFVFQPGIWIAFLVAAIITWICVWAGLMFLDD